MKFAQRYVHACDSSDLTNDIYHSTPDPLTAAALCLKFGPLLFRVKFANDTTSVKTLLIQWTEIVEKKAVIRNWPPHISRKKVAALSLAYWLNDRCELCKGRAFQPLKMNPQILSDDPCPRCKGTGRNDVRCDRRLHDYVTELVGEMDEMAVRAAERSMAKIGKDMEL
jgi:hypothetical protein